MWKRGGVRWRDVEERGCELEGVEEEREWEVEEGVSGGEGVEGRRWRGWRGWK